MKNPPAMQETRVCSLSQKDPLGKEMATHSSILAGRIPWSLGVTNELDATEQLSTHAHTRSKTAQGLNPQAV